MHGLEFLKFVSYYAMSHVYGPRLGDSACRAAPLALQALKLALASAWTTALNSAAEEGTADEGFDWDRWRDIKAKLKGGLISQLKCLAIIC